MYTKLTYIKRLLESLGGFGRWCARHWNISCAACSFTNYATHLHSHLDVFNTSVCVCVCMWDTLCIYYSVFISRISVGLRRIGLNVRIGEGYFVANSTNNETLQDGCSEPLTRPTRLENVPVLSYVRYIRVGGFIFRICTGFVRFFYCSYVQSVSK